MSNGSLSNNPTQSRPATGPDLGSLAQYLPNVAQSTLETLANPNVSGVNLDLDFPTSLQSHRHNFNGSSNGNVVLAALDGDAQDLAGELVRASVKSAIKNTIQTAPQRRAEEEERAREKAEAELAKAKAANEKTQSEQRHKEIKEFSKIRFA